MKISTSSVTKLAITGVSDMDAISAMIEDFGPGAGKITITCAGEAWTHYWSHMGKHHTMRSFFLKCDTPYLIGKLKSGIERRIYSKDDELLQQALRKHILKRRREGRIKPDEARELWDEAEYASFDGEYQELCQLVFGPEWWFNLPKEDNPDYLYLGKIVDTVKAAFSLEEPQQGKAGMTQAPEVDPADIIAGALCTSRGHAIEIMQRAVDANRAACAAAEKKPRDSHVWS